MCPLAGEEGSTRLCDPAQRTDDRLGHTPWAALNRARPIIRRLEVHDLTMCNDQNCDM